jgi:hypothetical protein
MSAPKRVGRRRRLSEAALALDTRCQRETRLELGGLEIEDRHEVLVANL